MYKVNNHHFDEAAVKNQDDFITTSSGTKHRRQTTKGVSIFVKWRDVNTTLVDLKDLEMAYPVQLAECGVAYQIHMKPAFAWWVPRTLQMRSQIIAKVKYKYWLKTHKFGLNLPKNMNQLIKFDCDNGNTLRWDSVWQYMKNICPIFEPL